MRLKLVIVTSQRQVKEKVRINGKKFWRSHIEEETQEMELDVDRITSNFIYCTDRIIPNKNIKSYEILPTLPSF